MHLDKIRDLLTNESEIKYLEYRKNVILKSQKSKFENDYFFAQKVVDRKITF